MNNLKHEQSTPRITWTLMMGLLGGRLLAISGFLVVLSFVLAHDGIAFFAFIAFAYIITIPYSLWLRNQDRMRQLAPLQFLVDLVFVSGLIYFAGGTVHNLLILLYPLIILSAGIILPLRQTVQITILAIISYVLVIVLMSQKILVAYPAAGSSEELGGTLGIMLLRIALFASFGVASAYVSRRCDYTTRKEKQFRELTQIVFKNVRTGLLLLDSEDRILLANDRACALLGRDESGLLGKTLSSIHRTPSEINGKEAKRCEATDYFCRPDGSVFPVSIEDARITLPAEAVPHTGAPPDTEVTTRIINFNDLSGFIRLQNRTRQLERIKAAANMAGKMAHQIRTPLTGISGAVQLLQLPRKKPEDETVQQEREELFQLIIGESRQMDQVIQKFLDYSEFSASDVEELIQMNIDSYFEPAGRQ